MPQIVSFAGSAATSTIIISLVTVIFSVGTEVTVGECLAVLRDRRLMLSALRTNFFLVPILGLGSSVLIRFLLLKKELDEARANAIAAD